MDLPSIRIDRLRMKDLSNARTKRNSAVALLLLWVFAIANACAFDPLSIGGQFGSGGPSIFDAGDVVVPSVAGTDVVMGIAIDSSGSNRPEGPCVDTSRFGPLSVVGILPDAGSEHPIGFPPAVTPLTMAISIDLVQRQIDELRPLETAIPLRLRYARLTL